MGWCLWSVTPHLTPHPTPIRLWVGYRSGQGRAGQGSSRVHSVARYRVELRAAALGLIVTAKDITVTIAPNFEAKDRLRRAATRYFELTFIHLIHQSDFCFWI